MADAPHTKEVDELFSKLATHVDETVRKRATEVEAEFLRLLQIVDQRLNTHDKMAQKVAALESRCAALERKQKA
jgi:BMFP domain-containing protein YqiC